MVDGARIREFWSHWNHEPDESKEFERFRVRMSEVSRRLWANFIENPHDDSLRERFAITSGTTLGSYSNFERGGLYDMLESAKDIMDVAYAVQFLLWTLERTPSFDNCCEEIQEAFDLSPTIMVRLVRRKGAAILQPSGAKLLDDAVVDSNLIWLSRYPDVLKPFEAALKIYMTKDPKQYRGMLDNLRFCLEQMLRAALNNQKSLEHQKDEFLRWLKLHDVHGYIGTMYHDVLFKGFAGYQNEAVKHQEDKYTLAEVEFMLYSTGTFLRLIQRLLEVDGRLPIANAFR